MTARTILRSGISSRHITISKTLAGMAIPWIRNPAKIAGSIPAYARRVSLDRSSLAQNAETGHAPVRKTHAPSAVSCPAFAGARQWSNWGRKARAIQSTMVTTFWHPDGTPITAQQFMEILFGKLPEFFKNEEELRKIWSVPDTRKLLLHGLAEKGFGRDQLLEMQKIIDAEKSDIYDVLTFVAYALPPLTREARAAHAKAAIDAQFTSRQQAFLDFVLAHFTFRMA